jgi:PBSX family phage terminase large subunit
MTDTATEQPETTLDEDLAAVYGIMSPKQILSIALSRQHVVALWVGAVSAGKTFASLVAFLIAVAFAPRGESIVIIGQTIQTIERNVLSTLMDFKKFGPLALLTVHTRNSGTAVILGRIVELVGAYNVTAETRIRGGTFGLVYVDEATLLPGTEFFNMLLTRLRVKGARMLATTNPASKNHWLRKDYILDPERHDLITFHFTMDDNPSLEPSYVARMKGAFSGVFFKRMILGLWTNAEGAIYDVWDEKRHVIPWDELPPIMRLLGVGIDHGTSNATSAMLLGITAEEDAAGRWTPRLVLIDEWRYDSKEKDPDTGQPKRRMTNVEQSTHVRAWLRSLDRLPPDNPAYGSRIPTVFVDPAAADFREQLQRDGIPNSPADNAVAEGISEISGLLGQGRLIVTDRCKGFLDEVTEYAWDPKATEEGEDEPIKLNDHSLDAARYIIRSTRQIWIGLFRRAYDLAT